MRPFVGRGARSLSPSVSRLDRADLGGGLPQRLVDRRMTRWPASKARSDAIMSTMDRAASDARGLERAGADLAGAGGAGGGAGDEVVALLARVRRARTTSSARGSTRPSSPTRTVPPAAAQHRVALRRSPAAPAGETVNWPLRV